MATPLILGPNGTPVGALTGVDNFLFKSGSFAATLGANTLTGNRSLNLPDRSGTLATIDQVPSPLAIGSLKAVSANSLTNATWVNVPLLFTDNPAGWSTTLGGVIIPFAGILMIQGQLFYTTSTANMTLAGGRARLTNSAGTIVAVQEFNRSPVAAQYGVIDVSAIFQVASGDRIFVDGAPYFPSGACSVVAVETTFRMVLARL